MINVEQMACAQYRFESCGTLLIDVRANAFPSLFQLKKKQKL